MRRAVLAPYSPEYFLEAGGLIESQKGNKIQLVHTGFYVDMFYAQSRSKPQKTIVVGPVF